MNKKRLLITGATGFLGFRTLERLVQEDEVEHIIAAGRVLKDGAIVQSDKVDYRLGDLQDMEYVKTLFEGGITDVVHCAALSSPWGKYQEFYNANVIPIKNLIAEIQKNPINRFINISTSGVYFEFKNKTNVKEDDPLPRAFVNDYAATKRKAELILEASGLNYISLRPRALIGRGDTVIMPRLIRAFNEGKLKIIGTGKNKVDLTPVGNAVEAIRLGLNAEEKALNQHYNITNGKPVLLWDKIRSVLKELGLTLNDKRIPFSIAITVAHLMEVYASMFQNNEPTLTRYSVGTIALNFTMDITKAKTLLGYQPIITVDECIEEFVEWYKARNHE